MPGKAGAGYSYAAQGNSTLVAPNITPDRETGAGAWTDDMLARSIREGIGHDGRALFPAMWYASFRHLSDEDVASVVVYVRSIPSVHRMLPRPRLNLVQRLTAAYLPAPIREPVAAPDASDPIKRGEYLVRIADCSGCHTSHYYPKAPVHEQQFGGGNLIAGPIHNVMSPNLTFDPSGIGYYSEDTFIRAMRTGKVGARNLDSVMPWGFYRNLTDDDLRALFAYLRTQQPVRHYVPPIVRGASSGTAAEIATHLRQPAAGNACKLPVYREFGCPTTLVTMQLQPQECTLPGYEPLL